MIKHSTYLIVVAIVVFMFALFQFAIFNIGWNDTWVTNAAFTEHRNAVKSIHVEEKSDAAAVKPVDSENAQVKELFGEPKYFVIVPAQDKCSANIIKMLKLLKHSYAAYESLDALPETVPEGLTGLIICEGNLDRIGNINILFQYAQAGKDTIFAKMFDTTAANYQLYHERFGIVLTGDRYIQKGVDFLNKLLVSGIFFNADVTTVTNRLQISGKSLILAVGYDENIKEYHERNPMIWRTYWEGGAMYCFNNNFLDEFEYVGVFTGVLSLNKDVFIYPIINTKMVALDGIPYLSMENNENILKAYSRNVIQFQFDVLWIDLIGITKNFDVRYTLYPKVGIGQSEVEKELISSFGKAVSVNQFEIGLYPGNYFDELFKEYSRSSSLRYPMQKTRSQIVFDPSDFAYSQEGVVNLPVISKTGDTESNEQTFKALSVESALGYNCHYVDLVSIMENPNADDLWTEFKLNFIEGYYPISMLYPYLDINTATESANKVNLYLDMVPKIDIGENVIMIKAQPAGEVNYILRTGREILGTENCTVEKINNDYFLLKVSRQDAVIHTKRGV